MPSPSENWQQFAKRLGAKPLLSAPPRIVSRNGLVEITSNQEYVRAVLFVVGALLCLILGWLFHELTVGRKLPVVLWVFPAISLWLGMRLLANRSGFAWKPERPSVKITRATLFPYERLIFPRAALGISLDVEAVAEAQRGDTVIKLKDLHSGSELLLIRSNDHGALREVFLKLAEAASQAEDKTMDSVVLAGGIILPCSRIALGKGSLPFKARRLEFDSAEVARFAPTPLMRLTVAGMLLLPLVLVGLFFGLLDWGLARSFFGELLSILGAIATFWGTNVKTETQVITVDRFRGALTIKPWWALPLGKERQWLLSDIAALQMCSRWTPKASSKSQGQINYEINLLLKTPLSERVHLWTDRNERRLHREARGWAAFLGLPLLDHRVSETLEAAGEEGVSGETSEAAA